MSRGMRIFDSSSAWWALRGKPSRMKPRVVVSSCSKRAATTPMVTSSGTNSPDSMYSCRRRPKSVPDCTAARNMSPVEMWGTT